MKDTQPVTWYQTTPLRPKIQVSTTETFVTSMKSQQSTLLHITEAVITKI